MNTNESSGKVNVGSLLREGLNDQQVLAKLRDQYPSDKELVRKMFDEWEEQNNRIKRKARKFAELILTRYNHLGPKRILEKARKFKAKYNFTEDEFEAFKNLALSDKALSQTNMYNSPNTPMGKTLGQMDTTMSKMNVKPNELDVLQEILRMHQDNSTLHTQVVLQSLMYRVTQQPTQPTYPEIPPEALYGKFISTEHNVLNHVHPVVAALFLPRIKYLDEHMLIGSISSIVASRHQNMPIKDRPTWELYWDIITDPNEVACVGHKDSPVADLRNRVALQVELWKAVKNLRQGRFFDPEVAGFTAAVDRCRNYVFDAADYMLVKDEGTILRRLLGAFSLRPTVVSIEPFAYNLGGNFGPGVFNYPLAGAVAKQVVTIPVINLRIPFLASPAPGQLLDLSKVTPILLNQALDQTETYVENRMIVPKKKEVLYSRDVVFFYINRRYQQFNFQTLAAPYATLNQLPVTASGFETLNVHDVEYTEDLTLKGSDKFLLESAVSVTSTNMVNTDKDFAQSFNKSTRIITGCKAFIRNKLASLTAVDKDIFYEYCPMDARSRASQGGSIPVAGATLRQYPPTPANLQNPLPISETLVLLPAGFDYKNAVIPAGDINFNKTAGPDMGTFAMVNALTRREGTILVFRKDEFVPSAPSS
jgi:hypothetical protein